MKTHWKITYQVLFFLLQGLSSFRMRKPSDSLRLEGLQELHPEYQDAFIEYQLQKLERPIKYKPLNCLSILEGRDIDREENER